MLFGACIPTRSYDVAVSAGFDYVEFSGAELSALSEEAYQAVAAKVSAGPIPCLALNSYCNGLPPFVGERFDLNDNVYYAQHLFQRAAALGVRMVGIGAPKARLLSHGYDRALARRQCLSLLAKLCEIGRAYNLQINFEQLNPGCCDFGTTTDEVVGIVRELEIDNLGLVVDFYHRAKAGEPITGLTSFADLIGHTHISTSGAGDSRGYPSEADVLTYRKIMRELKQIHYHAAMSIEATAKDLLQDGQCALNLLHRLEREFP